MTDGFFNGEDPLKNGLSPELEATLLIDALYFHAAQKSLKEAKKTEEEIREALNQLKTLQKKEREILKSHNGDHEEAHDELEPIQMTMASVEHDLGEAYGPRFHSLAVVHILCVAALESHINLLAKESLTGHFFDNFEKLSLEGKWLFLPKILNLPGFNPSKQPFQSFSRLLKIRNDLLHFKRKREEWKSGKPPLFLEQIGLTQNAAEKSISCVRKMIREISKQMKNKSPQWLHDDIRLMDYFDYIVN